MSQEIENNNTLSLYYALEECYEEVEVLFHKENVDFTRVINGLQKCCLQIEQILLHENNNCTFLVHLLHLKENASNLLIFLENDKKTTVKISNNKPYLKASDNQKQEEKLLIESFIEIPRINGLKEVAGLWEAKRILKSLIILPKSQPQLFANRETVNTALLFGPPGTGKTRLIHALCYDSGALLFSVTASTILSPYVGKSEKNIKSLFEHIRNKDAFCLLFVDEVDGFCRKRRQSEQEFSRSIKTELLCQLNKMESYSNFFFIAATNCPWDLDTAFLRRFQKRIYIPLPSYPERRELFRMFTKNTQLEGTFKSWEHLIAKTEGFSGSDISDLVQQALSYPIMELEDIKIWKHLPDGFYEPIKYTDDFNKEEITYSELDDLPTCSIRAREVIPRDLENALDAIKLTVSDEDIERYNNYNNNKF